MDEIEILSPDKLASPGLLFTRRAELQHAKAKWVKTIEDGLARLRAIDRECDRLDCVIARHLEAEPARVISTSVCDRYTTHRYTIQIDDGLVACRPCEDVHRLDRLSGDEVNAALAEHAKYLMRINDRRRPRFTADEVREAALHEATRTVFGADAATAIRPDDATEEWPDEIISLPGRQATIGASVSVIDQEAS